MQDSLSSVKPMAIHLDPLKVRLKLTEPTLTPL